MDTTESTFVSYALFISRGASKLDPVIIAIPRCQLQMPDIQVLMVLLAWQPLCLPMKAQEGIRCQHVGLFIDVPAVGELGKMEEAGSISGLGVWCKCITDGHYSGFDK